MKTVVEISIVSVIGDANVGCSNWQLLRLRFSLPNAIIETDIGIKIIFA